MMNTTEMKMYFAVDKLSTNFIDELLNSIQIAISKNRNLMIYALVDASFEYAQNRKKSSLWKEHAFSLYEGTEYDGLKVASPNLLPIHPEQEKARFQIRDLLKTCNRMPMVSFIASTLLTNELIESFKPFFEVCVDDEQSFLLRFADTRILPILDSILCEENLAGWRYGISNWWMPDRTGNVTSLPEYSNNQQKFNSKHKSLSLSQDLFNRLTMAGESDAILDAIFEQNEDLLKTKTPSEVYGVTCRLQEKIADFNIRNFPDAVMFCTTALATSEGFYTHPDFNKVLKSGSWALGKLGQALAEIDDLAWAEIEK